MGKRKLISIPTEQPPRRRLRHSRAQKAPGTVSKSATTAQPPAAMDATTAAAAPALNPYQRMLAKLRADGVGVDKSSSAEDDEAGRP